MPQISKRRVNEKILKRIGDLLLGSVLRLKERHQAAGFLNTLLTSTERTMLAKRLSIAVLLAKGYDYNSIKDILKVSQGTVWSVRKTLSESEEGYQKVIQDILREDKIKKLFLNIEELFDFLPPKGGDWKTWGKKKWERKKEIQKPL